MLLLAMIPAMPAMAADDDAPSAKEMRELTRELGGQGLEGEALAQAVAAAQKYPLGSKQNPVRVDMPSGEEAYLDHLRCPGGEKPSHFRAGNIGVGPYGYILDDYQVTCPGAKAVEIDMDMYHDTGETRPVPGFTTAN